jgi:hypothetical protein
MSLITTNTADKLNRLTPTTQETALGTLVKDTQQYGAVIFEKAITASAAANVACFTAPFAMRITFVSVRCTVDETNGTLQPKKDNTAMCTAITCAVNKVVTNWSAGVETAQVVLAAGDVVNVIATGNTAANVRGVITFFGIRL